MNEQSKTDRFEPDLPAHAAINFEDVDRDLLLQYAQILNVPIKASEDDDKIREALCNKLGSAFSFNQDGEHVSQPIVPAKKLSMQELYNLNLSGRGAWEGRRRLVTISRPENYKGDQPIFFGWNRQRYWIRPNHDVSVPLPVFNILRTCRAKRLVQVRKTREDGTQVVLNKFVEYQRIPFSDMGDDPETIHLPISQKEQFRLLAGMTNNFQTMRNSEGKAVDFGEAQLRAVARRLNIKVHDLPHQGAAGTVRGRIMEKLGLVQTLEEAAL